jgi:hypothetical protein
MEEQEFQFFDLLKKHDFWYTYSDDHRYYIRGRDERKVIYQKIDECPKLIWIWDKFCRAVSDQKTPSSLEELRRD